MKKDLIFAKPVDQISEFVFDEHVVNVFSDMIKRSVPGYDVVISMIGVLAEQYAQPGSNCYDLGCSTGAVTLVMRHRIRKKIAKIISIDNSQAMVDRCKVNVLNDKMIIPVEVMLADIVDVDVENASIVTLNFTLQFVDIEKRVDVLNNIYSGLLKEGVLVLSEKIRFDNKEEEKFQMDMHDNFKKLNGYSDLEISQKRTALENVLVPETLSTHIDRLKSTGFSRVYAWFQTFNFVSIVAFK
ncbi:MAG: carboxy-S-adenosyl-L-methionine synthase CmoA [Gammaproteobacteria bacterium]|nr:carboxy-S-adenosyl-L-methionine synthase CmoA [Gammaproteobacteria bacterium]